MLPDQDDCSKFIADCTLGPDNRLSVAEYRSERTTELTQFSVEDVAAVSTQGFLPRVTVTSLAEKLKSFILNAGSKVITAIGKLPMANL
jgi:hypothetical protein